MYDIAEVVVFNLDPLDYLVPEGMEVKIGDFVKVPFRSKKTLGLVWSLKKESTLLSDKLKFIEQKLKLSNSEVDRKFIEWVAEYYLFSVGHVLKMHLPQYIADLILQDKLKNETIACNSINFIEPNFSAEQTKAIDQIFKHIGSTPSNVIIEGVTGSGKTEIYLAAANIIFKNDPDAQILILLPEISLTQQITDRIKKRFSTAPIIWHSNITNKERHHNFVKIINGNAKIIIGARSALFLPYKNLKMIILDEEHDHSYKQEEGVTYQARDMAIMRAKLGNFPVILASASPSLESVHNVNLGKLNLVTLESRYNMNKMPKVHIVNMKKNSLPNSFISSVLLNELKSNFAKKEQSLLFLNRKGYAPAVLCKSCGYKICCNHCSTSMVYHKSQKKLKCHQCGYVAAMPRSCPSCKSEESLIPYGPGIERLLEEIKVLIPEAKIVTLTQDSFINLKRGEEMINAIINREYDIIIGTQIIAKGHHFPSLTLVGVIDADLWGGVGDLRSAEKTFQLLQQVGGRAGREIEDGKIFIQTYNPEHPLIQAIAKYDKKTFIAEEMKTREEMNMPPFGRLAAIILSSKQEKKLHNFAAELIKAAPNSGHFSILGPAPAIIYKLRGKFRYRILIKTSKNINIQKFIKTWLSNIKTPNYIHLKIDIDPYYFL